MRDLIKSNNKEDISISKMDKMYPDNIVYAGGGGIKEEIETNKESTMKKYLDEYEEDANAEISAEAKRINEWIYSQKWSDANDSMRYEKEKMINDFESKFGVEVDRGEFAKGGSAFNTQGIHTSLKNDYDTGVLTLQEVAEEFHKAGHINSVDIDYAKREMEVVSKGSIKELHSNINCSKVPANFKVCGGKMKEATNDFTEVSKEVEEQYHIWYGELKKQHPEAFNDYVKPKPTKEKIQNKLKGLKVLQKRLKGDALKKVNSKVKGLEVLVKRMG